MNPVLEILHAGSGATLQDLGRPGWKRHGIPPGGAMDVDSARAANRLVGNEESEPIIEFLFTGAKVKALAAADIAITGARIECSHAQRRRISLQAGEEVVFSHLKAGVWSYLALRGGFAAPRWFGSASVNVRAGLGMPLKAGSLLAAGNSVAVSYPPGAPGEYTDGKPPIFSVHPGPDWPLFSHETKESFFKAEWTVSPQSDRSGYRLQGPSLGLNGLQILSSPVAVGTIQISEQPIVILRDGPTVGGYPRLGILELSGISAFTQCAPGTPVRFRLSPR